MKNKLIRVRVYCTGIVLACGLTLPFYANAGVAIIANKSVPLNAITEKQASILWLKKKSGVGGSGKLKNSRCNKGQSNLWGVLQ